MSNLDITKIALSKTENKTLRWIAKNEPIDIRKAYDDQNIKRLCDRGFVEATYSDQYPYEEPPRGLIGIPANAIQLTDAGHQFLNYTQDKQSEKRADRRHDWAVAITSALIGAIAGGLVGYASALLTLTSG